MTLFVVGLTLAASLSPLLTFAHLFQLKEWRWDRLREHMRSEGWLTSLFGRLRPIVVLGGTSLLQVSGFPSATSSGPSGSFQLSALYILILLTLLNATQILLRKQPHPVWTKKAITLIATSPLLTTAASYGLWVMGYGLFLVFLPLLQPIFLLAAWILWKPIDSLLKQRILARAHAIRSQFPNITAIGITGSAGKTTTKELLAHILGPERAIATPEHVNSELGIARWLVQVLGNKKNSSERVGLVGPTRGGLHIGKGELMRGKPLGFPLMIVEMGAYRQGEIATICDIAQPTMGIVTSIGTQHIGLFGSQRAIAEAKGELFEALPPNGHAFLPVDTLFAQELQKKCRCPVTLVSATATHANLQATNIEETSNGLRCTITSSNEPTIQRANVIIPLHGEHQLGNILLAIAAAEKLGMTLENIAQRCKTFQPPSHTFSLREENGIHILDDTHNASPESLRAAIEWARHQPHSPKILITPGVIEQGRTAARLHFQCGSLAKDIFDEAFVLNKKLAHYFAQGFGKPVHHLTPKTYYLTPGTLLACVGRIPQNIIQRFLS